MMCNCRLCGNKKELMGSHIVSKMFYNEIKKNSITKGFRTVDNPNQRLQDGLKVPFLCHECEELFSKYEVYFSNNILKKIKKDKLNAIMKTDSDEIRYFVLSLAWRVLQYNVEKDENMLNTFTSDEKAYLFKKLENWRTILLNKEYLEIAKEEMFMIPTTKLDILEEYENWSSNNVGMDFRVLGNENSFEYAYVYIKVPYFIFICTVWGKSNALKSNIIGKEIKPKNTNLPKFLRTVIMYHLSLLEQSKEKLTDKQREAIIKRIEN